MEIKQEKSIFDELIDLQNLIKKESSLKDLCKSLLVKIKI
jgi:hypothetical protein